MALTLPQATIIKTRLEQQAAAQNMDVSKYISSMSMIPAAKQQQLYSQYNEAVKMLSPTVPSTTQSIVQERLADQVAAWNKEHGTNYTTQQYLDMLSKSGGTTITQKTIDVLTRETTPPSHGSGAAVFPPGADETIPSGADETIPPEIKITDRSWVTLPATSAELQTIATAKDKGLCVGAMKSYYTVKTYKVALKDGGVIYVEALSEKEAKTKAINAGYKVAWATWRPSTWTPTTTTREGTTSGIAPAIQPQNITVGVYQVTDQIGRAHV